MKQEKTKIPEFIKDLDEETSTVAKDDQNGKVRSKLMEAALQEVENMNKPIKH
ncbi:MAG: hypothetical protein PHD48_03575 [Alphaproteobacteria bacterium]|nr:hypothetical protein [Alphaproteobacteria bacterium]